MTKDEREGPVREIRLPGDYLLQVFRKSIVMGRAVLYFPNGPNDNDIHAVKAIFAMGAAANGTHVAMAWDIFQKAVNNPIIVREGTVDD